ncbi:MAG: hypothetical protein EBX52_06725 [Proteobacteria bacterium]|nr:hypothetical protein [Pseudomonadota bacterium]
MGAVFGAVFWVFTGALLAGLVEPFAGALVWAFFAFVPMAVTIPLASFLTRLSTGDALGLFLLTDFDFFAMVTLPLIPSLDLISCLILQTASSFFLTNRER